MLWEEDAGATELRKTYKSTLPVAKGHPLWDQTDPCFWMTGTSLDRGVGLNEKPHTQAIFASQSWSVWQQRTQALRCGKAHRCPSLLAGQNKG